VMEDAPNDQTDAALFSSKSSQALGAIRFPDRREQRPFRHGRQRLAATPVQYLEKLADVARAITYRSDCCIDILGLTAECGGESVNCAPIADVHASFIAVRLDRVDCERHCDSVDSVIAIVRPIGLSVLDLRQCGDDLRGQRGNGLPPDRQTGS